MSENITAAKIDRLKYDPRLADRQILWDSKHTGLGVRVRASGRKTFVMQWGDRTNRRLITKGSVQEYDKVLFGSPLEEAIDWWTKEKAKENQGVDLLAAKVVARHELLEGTIAKLVDEYLAADHGWSPSHTRDSKRRGEVVKREFGGLRPEDLKSIHVRALHKKITDRGSPIEANRQSTFVHSLYDWASEMGLVPETLPNPAYRRKTRRSKAAQRSGGLGRNREHRRSRVLLPSEGEYLRLLEAADSQVIQSNSSPMGERGEQRVRDGVFIRMLILTGLRRDELLLRKWADVDWKQKTLFVPGEGAGSTKNGRDHYIPLGPRGLELLESLRDPQVISLDRNAPIFCREDMAPWRDCVTAWRTIRDRADLKDWGSPNAGFQMKDLRATVSTWLREFRGRSLEDIGVLLNHTPMNQSVTEAHYSTDLGRRLKVMRSLVEDLEEIMDICEAGREKVEFETAGFTPALLASNGG
jgi:integrase